jgi:hypothetical protein
MFRIWHQNIENVEIWHNNGRESAVNTLLDGSNYPGWKLVPSSLCKKNLAVKKWSNLYLGSVMPSSGWLSPIKCIGQNDDSQ